MIAQDYLAHVVSPFDEGTVNPIFDALRRVKDADKKTVADLGCG